MKRTLPFLLFLISLSVAGQYNNEWIRNSQTYFKFKILNKGLYHIPKSALDAVGIGNTGAEYFELWRNGKQVPIYTSSASGPLASNGYIEFWGEGNDGKPDKAFYRNPAFQHSTEISLLSDSAVYFLSVNTNQSGFTYVDPGNDVAGNSLPVEQYFMDKSAKYYNDKINPGFAAVVGEYVYSSSYDKGEFWSSNPVRPGTPLVTTQTGLNVYSSGPDATLRYGTMGDALNPRSVKVSVNGNLLQDTVMDYFNDLVATLQVPLTMISAGTAAVQFENTSIVTTDRMVMSFFEIIYPRPYDFNNQKFFKFSLPASGDKYIEVTNFNYGTTAPVLLNITTGERITGDISTPGIVKLVVPAGGAREFVLVNTEAANVNTVATLTPKTFKVFTDPANQGNYLIITNKALFTGSHGNNPVDEYKNYRASSAGGGYNVQVIDVDELVDQFGFGIKKNPLGIKNFIRFARNKFQTPPKHVLLIGRGMAYNDYRLREGDALAEQLNLVPSWGSPASDNLLSSEDAATPVAVTPIGRLSVIKGKEIEDYLEKVIEYEAAQKNAANTLEGREWMKNIVHVTGSSDPYLGTVLCNYMHAYRQIIQDTMYGGKVSTFCKVSTNSVEQLNNEKIASLFEEGISILTYFGHSSSTTLEFNLDNPQAYNNQGKYPVFFVNGCNAGNFFTYNGARLSIFETLSEKFVLAKQRGSIAFVASTHFGIVNYLNIYLNHLYVTISKPDFGKSLGETVRDALAAMITVTGTNDYYARLHAEEMTIHGDPAITINEQPKPDYILEESQVKVNPAFISVAEESFQVKIKAVNLGKAVSDSIVIEVKRQYPDGASEVINRVKIAGIRYADSITINVPVVSTRDKGLNKLTITVDADNIVDEITESNNTISKDVFIYEDEARTVYPYNYAIITNPTQKLSASTANPLSPNKQYLMEMDTTALFNSAFKISKTTTSIGGLLEFDPGITYVDKRVYYWRVSPVPQTTGSNYVWNTASFIYINGTKEGFNQSHRYQHADSKTERMSLNENGNWVFGTRNNHLFIRNGVYPFSGRTDNDFSIDVNGTLPIASACVGSSLIFNVFDSVTFKPWKNVDGSGNNLYLSGSGSANCAPSRNYNFEFTYMTAQSRKYMMNFMDSIPNGSFVVVRNIPNANFGSNTYIDTWQSDTALYGSFNSLYHRLLGAGFTKVDSLTFPRSFIFVYKKGNYDFVPKMEVSQGVNDRVTLSAECITPDSLGFITSPVFGPAKSWNDVIWNGASVEAVSNDNPTVDVIGIDAARNETVLFTMDRNTHNLDISSVDATTYPEMKLRMRNIDSISLSPYQLTDWKIYYQPLPEGAVAPNLLIDLKDTVEIGEPLNIAVAFKNVSPHPFDSISVKMNVLDKNNVAQNIVVPKQKPLLSGDTIALRVTLDSKNFADGNTLFLEFNPPGNQPEQYHFNNFLFKNFYVRVDRYNPLLDVTFDGVHILNRDLVSARPHIQIKLKDDAKFLLMNDTALSSVQIRYPDGTIHTHHFDNDTLRFTPATSSTDNSAVVDFFPVFDKQYNPEGDEYELIVKGKDRSGNKASNDYRIAFTVITKAMISNMLNYPNPFSTSTAFVFTITGSEIPQNMKVQILTVTGKIVREVTKEELGPLHIGRNITEFKWDGTDQFGQKLANGVYLYRFVTTLNGQRMEKYKAKGDNTDMFFNNGYGKMYLMR